MTAIAMLAQISADFGFPAYERTIPGPYDCPTHHVPLQTNQVSTFSGWHQLNVCPQFDGTCSYNPDGDPTPIDTPADAPNDDDDGEADQPAP